MHSIRLNVFQNSVLPGTTATAADFDFLVSVGVMAAEIDTAPFEAVGLVVSAAPLTSLICPKPSGGAACRARWPWTVSRAHICCPSPTFPSKPPTYHFCPHVAESSPPEHEFAAAVAVALRSSLTEAEMDGTIRADAYMKRDR